MTMSREISSNPSRYSRTAPREVQLKQRVIDSNFSIKCIYFLSSTPVFMTVLKVVKWCAPVLIWCTVGVHPVCTGVNLVCSRCSSGVRRC